MCCMHEVSSLIPCSRLSVHSLRYETTASALAFTIYALARHPEKMQKLVQAGPPAPSDNEHVPHTAPSDTLQRAADKVACRMGARVF